MKYCKDCKWSTDPNKEASGHAMCEHPDLLYHDYYAPRALSCTGNRDSKERCGPEAKLFQGYTNL